MRARASGAFVGAGSSRSTALTTSTIDPPLNAGVPESISYKTAPKLNTSERSSSSLLCACSGDIYAAVPRTVPSIVFVASVSDWATIFANPKSRSFAPDRVISTFPGFKSRWRTPR
jgi:hypothetical protein